MEIVFINYNIETTGNLNTAKMLFQNNNKTNDLTYCGRTFPSPSL